MNLNKLTLNQLRRHPYINFYQARAICDYSRLKGPLQSLGQLRLLNDFTPTAIERLQPYVEF
jgi:DNA uptake protein ComE-like DNA-binding protein